MRCKSQITNYDIGRLKKLLDNAQTLPGNEKILLKKLETKIENSVVVDQKEIPSYLVTMNSRLTIMDLAADTQSCLWLVYPEKALSRKDRISVVSDLGIAILGTKIGDEVEVVENQTTSKKVRIMGISYQPEAHNHFKL